MLTMSARDIEAFNVKQEDFPLLQELESELLDVSDCLSVTIDEENSTNTGVPGVILDDRLLGTTLATVTLPDGTQAFVLSKSDDHGVELKNATTLELDNGQMIFLKDLTEFSNNKVLEINSGNSLQTQGTTTKTEGNILSKVEFINGMTYMINDHVGNNDSSKTPDSRIIVNRMLETKMRHPCIREGCKKVYSTLHHLKVHERSHTGYRPYRCTHAKCVKSFSTGYSLKAHLRTHTGEKPYKCPTHECSKSFKTSGDLLKHIRTHTGERPFVCNFEGCGRSFTTSNIRKIHMRTHTGERPYKCTQPKCNKAFASATNYKNHIRIHSGEKPYLCPMDECGKRFTEYSSLYKHHLVHTQLRPYECKICCRKYRQNSTLIMHKKTVHALTESDDGDDPCSHDADNVISNTECGNITDRGTQIVLVGHPTEIAALQQAGFHENIEDPGIDGLNINIEDIELGWT